MQTEIIESNDSNVFHEKINDFIKNKQIYDIKYNSHILINNNRFIKYYSALIIYKVETK